MPTFLDTPEIEAMIVEAPDAQGPYGAKEADEGPLHSSIPGIANAIYDAVRIRASTDCRFPLQRCLQRSRNEKKTYRGIFTTVQSWSLVFLALRNVNLLFSAT